MQTPLYPALNRPTKQDFEESRNIMNKLSMHESIVDEKIIVFFFILTCFSCSSFMHDNIEILQLYNITTSWESIFTESNMRKSDQISSLSAYLQNQWEKTWKSNVSKLTWNCQTLAKLSKVGRHLAKMLPRAYTIWSTLANVE